MKLLDIHCHLDDSRFQKDLDQVVETAEKVGVKLILTSGTSPEKNRKALELSKKYNIVKPSFGIYPIDALFQEFPDLKDDDPREIQAFDYKKELEWIKENLDFCFALGEVGMDFKVIKEHKDFEKLKEKQKQIFQDIILFAKKHDLPIVIHSRGAELECIELLEKHKMKKVLMHCFGGKKSLITRCAENGWFLSVPAVITRLHHFQTLSEIVPIQQLLTETDAPYLAPVAGERSEPKDVASTIKEIAKIKNLSEQEVAEQIFKNAENFLTKKL